MIIEDWGRLEYGLAEQKQLDLFTSKVEKKTKGEAVSNHLVLVEHDHVYTLGRHANEANILPIARRSGATFHTISRGGDVTYHGPGQLVCYPILDLQQHDMGVRKYVSALEEVGIKVCADYGIVAAPSSEEGVWIDLDTPRARKIMAIGIKVSRYITMHGIAFNVCPDLNYFSFIIPCGIPNKGVTSLELELGRTIDMNEFKHNWTKRFLEVFS